MKRRICCVVLTAACLLGMPSAGAAQSSDVTFQVPLNVTKLSSDITKVAVYCEVTSEALPKLSGQQVGRAQKQLEFSPTAGQVVTTAAVVVPIPSLNTSASPTATNASYKCMLSGFSQALQRWDVFTATHSVAAFRLSPTPPDITGTFTW